MFLYMLRSSMTVYLTTILLVCLLLGCIVNKCTNRTVETRCLSPKNIENLIPSLYVFDWPNLLSLNPGTSESMFEVFIYTFLNTFYICCAIKTKLVNESKTNPRHNGVKWFTDNLRELKDPFMAFYSVYKNTNSVAARRAYIHISNIYPNIYISISENG